MNGTPEHRPPHIPSRARPAGANPPAQDGSDATPPSFAPSNRPRRPSTRGAKPVGPAAPAAPAKAPAQPAARRPAAPQSGAEPAATPPSPARHGVTPLPATRQPAASPADPVRLPQYAPARQPGATPGPRPAHPPATPPGAPPAGPRPGGSRPGPPRGRARRRGALTIAALVFVVLLAWPVGLLIWANGEIAHVDALSDARGTPGRVFLIAGSDSRADGGIVEDGTLGQRTDTIMVLTAPPSGTPSLISLPRDTLVEIPGVGPGKLNAAFSSGGAPLLVETVEELTGMKVDHYVEIGMGGVKDVVDAVGGVELCLNLDVDDAFSGLVWEAGCHEADGTVALAFARMRYADPTGDIGRTERQQQLISAVTREAASVSSVLNPFRQVSLIRAATGSLAVDQRTGIVDLARLAMTFRAATGPGGVRGTPPIADPDYRPGALGSTVLLEDVEAFFAQVADGSLEPTATPTPAQ